MSLTELHATLLSQAFRRVLGAAESGSMAFVRCLTGDIVKDLAAIPSFAPPGWQVFRVTNLDEPVYRSITADRAVELRESKNEPTLLLVDTTGAGAGMDGIYSAGREVHEAELFSEALRLAAQEITRCLSREHRQFAEIAVRRARGWGGRFSVSPWAAFDFFVRSAVEGKPPGEILYLVGLWPIKHCKDLKDLDGLATSQLFVNRLLRSTTTLTPAARIEALKLQNPTEEQLHGLEAFLRDAGIKPLFTALTELANKPDLWVNALRLDSRPEIIQGIELLSWRNRNGQLAKWSGLTQEEGEESPPVLILKPDAQKTGDYSKLEIRWKTRPINLEKGAAEYRVAILTDMNEELASREVSHSAKKEEKCRFTNDDFSTLGEDALISAKIAVSVIGNEDIEEQPSEEFIICFGEPPEPEKGGVGTEVRTFSEGIIEIDDRDLIKSLASAKVPLPEDARGFVLLRTSQKRKSFKVFRPSLIREVEKRWVDENGAIGRWIVKVRSSGARAGAVEFVPFTKPGSLASALWERIETASRRMAEHFGGNGGGVGQIYDEKARSFDTVVKEYLLAWAALFEAEECRPIFALVNTVEVQSLSGDTRGLIVPPSHPIRVAWHSAYDNLVLHARFEQSLAPKDIRDELHSLDGAMFPAFLPGLDSESSFVFADTLGFHAVGMVLDRDKEPKAAVALLARALGESETADAAPTVGKQSAQVLAKEIIKYIECHGRSRLLHIHALRPGDGFTIAKSLGKVCEHLRKPEHLESAGEDEDMTPAFVLELFPSESQRGVAGRFIAEVCEKRRSGAGVLSGDDHWMLQSLSLDGNVSLPRLRWGRRDEQIPRSAAHLAAAFDTFESRVIAVPESVVSSRRPLSAFGLMSFFERCYTNHSSPLWESYIPVSPEGERHPSDPFHTKRLFDLQRAIQRVVGINLGGTTLGQPLLRTEITAEKAESLRTLHSLCDWVITVDRNAGIEYFDSPRDNRDIYDAYVIDCVPEREDLGCLQLITSTSNLDEVRHLLDSALDLMGLSRSLRNAEFLLWHLKALSGRLAIRLTGRMAATGELIALSLVHANCRDAGKDDEAWTPLGDGFFVPVDDVRDLLPPLSRDNKKDKAKEQQETRPDLIHVSQGPRGGLVFRFVEVKYRRHLRAVRNPEDLELIRKQTENLRMRWEGWYFGEELSAAQRAIRRAKLARVLRFYADKARRHYLEDGQYQSFVVEINRMIASGASYSHASMQRCDRGFVFCPEYGGLEPIEISPVDWGTRVFLFGPGRLPDSSFRGATVRSTGTDYDPSHSESTPQGLSTDAAPRTSEAGMASNALEAVPCTSDMNGSSVHDVQLASHPFLDIQLGMDVLSAEPVGWRPSIKGHPHLLVVGLSGMGKTTCLINICQQFQEQAAQPIIFSYHQDIDAQLESLFGEVRFVDYDGLGYNPLSRPAHETRRTYLDIAGELRDIFLAIYPELGDIQGESLRQAIKESYLEQGWGLPTGEVQDAPEPEFGRFVEILRANPKKDRGLMTLLARLQELEDYGFFRLGAGRGSLWESDRPVIIRVHSTQNENIQRAFAALLFYGFYKEMFYRQPQERISHFIVFDEAHRAARLKLIPTMAQECRKYGVGLVLASQQTRDFDVRLFSLIANYLVLRLNDQDAKALVRNVASSDQERVLIDRIKQMEKYRAFFFCEGRKKPTFLKLQAPWANLDSIGGVNGGQS